MIGEYEASLKQHYAEVFARLGRNGPPRVKPPKPQTDIVRGPAPRWRRIVSEVCNAHGITFAEMLSHRANAAALHEACYRLRRETSLSFHQLSRVLRRDHSTVIYGVRKHVERMAAQQEAA